ncbi:MAG: DUF3842 family protein [Oscillospiraceae bacterium]|nr:DUF3842 family protein [Oscillospiraceae bacterium]MBQ7082161.1 DUF3842 family protein [Oscillospiraceae bacterium]MBR2636984.1 DUF3842 family protein [Oscillospiraceae bacterium]MBR6607358.1 DUF3842 family protein [Oscillospiraceae bacterium]
MKNILVIDGQGGQMGSQIIKEMTSQLNDIRITAVGTNATAAANMLKAGAHQAATGENPVVVACRKADVIIGPIGIVIADSLLGEVTPKMAAAVGQSEAVRILIPVNRCDNLVAGVQNAPLSVFLQDAVAKLRSVLENKGVAE